MNQQMLRDYFNFTEADLFENRNGRLSQSQRQKQGDRNKAYQSNRHKMAAFSFVIGILGFAGIIFLFKGQGVTKDALSGYWFGFVWMLLWGGWGVYSLRPATEFTEVKVLSERGRVRLTGTGNSQGDFDYELKVGNHTFDIDDNISGMVVEGEKVIVYYTDTTEEILSIEEVKENHQEVTKR